MINRLKIFCKPLLYRSVIYSISDFIFYICFTIWRITIVPPYNYVVDKLKLKLIQALREGGLEKVRIYLYFASFSIMVTFGAILRKIYDYYLDDWYTYIIFMVVTFYIGRFLGPILFKKLWDFWNDIYYENQNDIQRRRYDLNLNDQYHTVIYDVDTMFG